MKKIIYPMFIFLLFIQCEKDESDFSINGLANNLPSDENYQDYGENPFLDVSEYPKSSFSVDADGASYANMRRYLSSGQNPPVSSVRIEEYINYFTFDYDQPEGDEKVALNSELSTCPWNTNHYLMRLGMRGKTIPANELPGSNYVFLIDVSGSMSDSNKLELLKMGFKSMVNTLTSTDYVSIVTYASSPGILLYPTSGDQKEKIKEAINSLGAGGSTAGADGINTAYELAEESFIPNGNNRIIIGTDGDFNVGYSSTDDLVDLIETKRESGIYLTVLGVGTGNLNDEMMEQIANKGNGNYEYIDNEDQLMKVFVLEKNKFFTVAKDAKIQIEFNPEMVSSYRLIGYENRLLNQEEYENDSTDAGEIGSGQTITALYELVLKDVNLVDKWATFDFQYKIPVSDYSRHLTHEINTEIQDIYQSSANMKFVASITAFGLIMKQSDYKGSASKTMVLNLANDCLNYDPNGFRYQFKNLVSNWDGN